MAEFHRKIELQSPEDLQYLVANARRGAKEYLDKDFPPDARAEGDNSLHETLERNVNKYVNDTFTAAAPNMTINGMDITPSLLASILDSNSQTGVGAGGGIREEYEDYDAKLEEKLRKLKKEEEDLVEYIAKARRTVPGKRVGALKEGFKGVEGDEGVVRGKQEGMVGEAAKEEVVLEAGGLEGQRRADMERSWGGAVRGIGGLMRGLPETVAKKERAEEVERYVLGKEGKKGKR